MVHVPSASISHAHTAAQQPQLACRGDEAERIRAFKSTLGLTDEDAAPAHVDVGRRILRERYEAGSKDTEAEGRKVCGLCV